METGGEGKTRETYGGRKFITQNPRGVHAARQVHAPCVEFTPNRGHSTTHVMKQHPAEFENLFCHQGKALSASEIDRTFLPMLDPVGCNARDRQELVLMHWRDYLQETEGAVEKLKYECTFCPDHCHRVHGRRMGDLKMGGTTS